MNRRDGFIGRLLDADIRSDGRLVRDLDDTQKILPYFMRTRQSSSILMKETVDITETLRFIDGRNQGKKGPYSVFVILIAALVRTGALHPKLNRFVVGRRIYAKNKLQVSFVMKQQMDEEGKEVVVKLTFDPKDTLAVAAEQVNRAISSGRGKGTTKGNSLISALLTMPSFLLTLLFALERVADRCGLLPAALIESDPLFASAFVANLGSLKIGAPYHHLYERGTISLFVVLGEYKKADVAYERTYVDLAFTVDSRIAGGYAIAQALHTLKELLENPALLEQELSFS
ncbi:MAG: hypothetical protein ACM3ZQ_08415 [Bacillota bacterium]